MFSWYYIEGILIQSCYTLLIVLGLSILTGYTGMFSFGHAGFVCIGAYVSVIHMIYAQQLFPESFTENLNIPESNDAMPDVLCHCMLK